jgi:YVTN family beta-propeller protein
LQENTVYCANENSGYVTVIDGATNSIVAWVTVGDQPRALCYNPSDNKVYCANAVSSDVSVVDGATNSVIATLTGGAYPVALGYDPKNDKVYCGNEYSGDVTVIDGVTNSVLEVIGTGGEPSAYVHNTVQNRVYVANHGSSSISVFRDSVAVGIEESANGEVRTTNRLPTIVRGVLEIGSQLTANSSRPKAQLFDANGRKLLDLQLGPNDVSPLAPGVYFVVSERPVLRQRVIVVQ